MKFDEYINIVEADIGGGSHYPYMVHGRDEDMKDLPEEKTRMLDSIMASGENATSVYETENGSLRLRSEGKLTKTGDVYTIRASAGEYLNVATFKLGNIDKIITDKEGTDAYSSFLIVLKNA